MKETSCKKKNEIAAVFNGYSDNDKIETARRLKELRDDSNFSRETVIDKLTSPEYGLKNLSRDMLARYELEDIYHSSFGATKGMSVEKLFCFAKLYNVSTDYLLGLSDVQSPDLNLKATCDFTMLSEKTINAILNFKKPNSHEDFDTYYFDKHNLPPRLRIFNTLFEEGFLTELIDIFNDFLKNVVQDNNITFWSGYGNENEEKGMRPALYHLNSFIANAISDKVINSLISELSEFYVKDV